MAKATKRSRPGRRRERKDEAWVPLRRPALLAALGLAGWAPAGAAAFPPILDLSDLDGTNGFRLNGVAAVDFSVRAVSNAGDVNGDGLADLLIGAHGGDPNGAYSGAPYVVFGGEEGQGHRQEKRGKKLKAVLEIRNTPGTAFSNTPISIRLR